MRRWLVASLIAAVFATVVVLARSDSNEKSPTRDREAGVVEKIVDGDTLWIRLGNVTEKVRLVLIDTPETRDPETGVECYGPEATAELQRLIPVRTDVQVERALEERDRYGRLLAFVWRTSDRLLVNRDLVERGFAEVLVIAPNTQGAEGFQALQSRARAAHVGLWGACPDSSRRVRFVPRA